MNSVTTIFPISLLLFLVCRRPAALLYSIQRLINREGEYMPADQLSTTFAALADPTRRAILERLSSGEATVNELAEPFPISVQAISKHLQVLERAGLIERGRTAQLRPSRLRAAPLQAADAWLQTYGRLWSEGFDRLGERLRPNDG
jgi:DNA-binding transcriptional ArsR family regulator